MYFITIKEGSTLKQETKTYMAQPKTSVKNKWYLIDANGKVLGRLATKAATILMGKDQPEYTPHVDLKQHLIVINAEKIVIKGNNKPLQKVYSYYTGYRQGLKLQTLKERLEKKPALVVEEAIRRMLPKSFLAKNMMKKLRVYTGAAHTQIAQKPEIVEL